MKYFGGLLILISLLLTACNSYKIKKEIDNADQVKSEDSIVIVLRLNKNSRITREEYIENFKLWESGYTSKDISFYQASDELPDALIQYHNSTERFYQTSANQDYLKYKTLGIIKTYAARYKNEFQKIANSQNSKLVLFYEIGGTYSPNLKAMKFNSLITILNTNQEVLYLDHQELYISDADFDRDEIKKEFVDNLAKRLYTTLSELDFVKTL